MEDTVIVIMEKNEKTGFLDKELASLVLSENEDLIVNLFVLKEGADKSLKMHIRLSTGRDVADWEYPAVFDYYDTDIFNGYAENIIEKEDYYNPVWEIIFDYTEDLSLLEKKITDILRLHKKELIEVYENIKDKESEYNEKE